MLHLCDRFMPEPLSLTGIILISLIGVRFCLVIMTHEVSESKNFLELDVILLSKGLNTVDDKEDWFFFGRKVFKSCSNN